MWASLKLTRAFGIDIKVHVSFVLVLALAGMQWGTMFGARGVVFGVLSSVLLFTCVTLHELGHSVVAQRFGIPVKEITLWPFGGIAQLGARPTEPKQELLIAIAGPAVNVVIAFVLAGAGLMWLGPSALGQALLDVGRVPPTLTTLLSLLLAGNVILAVFNLIPALPMDGGRVLRALLAMNLGMVKATRIASNVARALAVVMFGTAFFTSHLMLAVIAAVVFFGAGKELADSQMGAALTGVRAGSAVNPHALVLAPSTSLGEAVKAVLDTGQIAFAVMHYGRLLGVVPSETLLKFASNEGPNAYVAGAMQRQFPLIDGTASLEEARQTMNSAVTPYVVVRDGDRYLGLVTEAELHRFAV